jgi:hypothetical protein
VHRQRALESLERRVLIAEPQRDERHRIRGTHFPSSYRLDLWCPALAMPRQSANCQPTEDHGDAGEHSG